MRLTSVGNDNGFKTHLVPAWLQSRLWFESGSFDSCAAGDEFILWTMFKTWSNRKYWVSGTETTGKSDDHDNSVCCPQTDRHTGDSKLKYWNIFTFTDAINTIKTKETNAEQHAGYIPPWHAFLLLPGCRSSEASPTATPMPQNKHQDAESPPHAFHTKCRRTHH